MTFNFARAIISFSLRDCAASLSSAIQQTISKHHKNGVAHDIQEEDVENLPLCRFQ